MLNLNRKAIACAIILSLGGSYVPSAIADDVGNAELQRSLEQSQIASTKLTTLQDAVSSFYTANLRWPTTLSELTSGVNVYYVGGFDTPFGTITGTQNGASSYSLTIAVDNTPSDYKLGQYETIAGLVGGDYVANTININVTIPYSASVVKNMLQRTEDTSGFGLNTMKTDLSLDGNDITNIKSLIGDNATLTNVLSSTVTSQNASFDDLTTVDFVVNNRADIVDGNSNFATFDDLKITNKIETKDLDFQSIDFTDLTVDNNTITDLLTVTNRATIDQLVAENVEFETGSFSASLSAINADADTLFTDELYVDKVLTPVSFNSPVVINDVATALSDVVINGTLNQTTGSATLGKTSIAGNLNAPVVTFKHDLTINNSVYSSSGNFKGNVTVYGRSDLNALVGTSANIANKLKVNGNATVNDELNLNGNLIAGKQAIAKSSQWYENGTKIVDKYYGINEKVADAELLSGKDSSKLAIKARSNIFSQSATFQNNIYVNGSIRSGSGVLIDSSGRLYDGGTLVSSHYATKSELASADSAINSKLTQVESAIANEMARRRSELKGYETRIASVQSQQVTLDGKASSIDSLLNQSAANLASAENMVDQGSTSLNGAKGKVSSLSSLGSSVKNLDAYKTSVTRRTHYIYKRYN